MSTTGLGVPKARRNVRIKSAAWRVTRAHWHHLVGAAAVIAVLAAWQASGAFLQPIFISTPSAAITSFGHLIANGKLPVAFATSLWEMVLALLAAFLVGVSVGLLMGKSRWVERTLNPLVAFGNSSPLIAILPILVVWFGVGWLPQVFFIFFIGVWTFIINTVTGVRAVRGGMSDVGTVVGLSGWQQVWKIDLPATVPYLLVGARFAMAMGAIGMIIAGTEIGESGLGGLALVYGSYTETSDLLAVIITTVVLLMLMFLGLRQLKARVFPWIAETSGDDRSVES